MSFSTSLQLLKIEWICYENNIREDKYGRFISVEQTETECNMYVLAARRELYKVFIKVWQYFSNKVSGKKPNIFMRKFKNIDTFSFWCNRKHDQIILYFHVILKTYLTNMDEKLRERIKTFFFSVFKRHEIFNHYDLYCTIKAEDYSWKKFIDEIKILSENSK